MKTVAPEPTPAEVVFPPEKQRTKHRGSRKRMPTCLPQVQVQSHHLLHGQMNPDREQLSDWSSAS
jgi:hypothetical protein